jgi:hypothetical protein
MTLIMTAIFVVMLAIAWAYPPGSRFMVLVVGIPAIALCLLQLTIDLSSGDRPRRAPLSEAGQDEDELPRAVRIRREIIVWGYFLGFIGITLFFGFWVAIPLLIFTFLWLMADVRFLPALITAAISTPMLFLFFEKLLETQLHRGFLMPQVWEALEKIEALAPVLKLLG